MYLNRALESAQWDSDQIKAVSNGTADDPATEAIKKQIIETPTAKYLNH